MEHIWCTGNLIKILISCVILSQTHVGVEPVIKTKLSFLVMFSTRYGEPVIKTKPSFIVMFQKTLFDERVIELKR